MSAKRDVNSNVAVESSIDSTNKSNSSPGGKKLNGKTTKRQHVAYKEFVNRNISKKVNRKKKHRNKKTNGTPPIGNISVESNEAVSAAMNVPGARRVSRARSSIFEASKSVKIDLQLKQDSPEGYYSFEEEIGRGKFAVIKKCTKKKTGEAFAAKLVKYDEDTQEFAKKEFHIWNGLSHPNLLVLHDAFLVRKYLILISDLVTGEQILDYLGKMENTSEEDVTSFVTQLIEALEYLHARQIVHLDIKPGNLMIKGTVLKLIDYGSSRKITNELGEVGEMVGTAEFMAPETINFEPVSWATDIWGVGVVTYALLSGLSPFACEDEDETMASVTALDYRFDPQAFATITEEAKSFIKSIVIRIPEKRPTASKLLEHSWFAEAFTKARESSLLDQDALLDLSEVLKDQDKLEEVRASAVLRTFLQSPHESPVSSEAEDDDEDGDDNDDVDE